MFTSLLFGLRSGPRLWGRIASWLARSTQALLRQGRVELYVDDPIIALYGTPAERRRELAIILTWIVVLGYRLSWKTAARGATVEWIGAQVSINSTGVSVTIPDGKVEELRTTVEETRQNQLLDGSSCRVSRASSDS